jgi:transposase
MSGNRKPNTLEEVIAHESSVCNEADAQPSSGSELEPKKLQAAVALAEGKTETEAAQLLGVNRTTIYRWYKQAAFVAEVNRLKQEYLTEHRAKMRNLVAKATSTLATCLDRHDSDPLKLKAAMFVLAKLAPNSQEPIGPITAEAIENQWRQEAMLNQLSCLG